MKKISGSAIPSGKYVFTTDVDYAATGEGSIWGRGTPLTLGFLRKEEIRGRWLNLAAGDGRYNAELLKKADLVVASDIDWNALGKLRRNTPEKLRRKLELKAFDTTKAFPLKSGSFDGVFCTGILHLFPKKILGGIFREIDRLLKPRGKIIAEFVTDRKRTSLLDGKAVIFSGERGYTMGEAKKLLKELMKNYSVDMHESRAEEEYKKASPPYKLACRFILLAASRN